MVEIHSVLIAFIPQLIPQFMPQFIKGVSPILSPKSVMSLMVASVVQQNIVDHSSWLSYAATVYIFHLNVSNLAYHDQLE